MRMSCDFTNMLEMSSVKGLAALLLEADSRHCCDLSKKLIALLSPDESHLRIVRAKDGFKIRGLEPVAEQGAVNAAEIHGVFDVTFR